MCVCMCACVWTLTHTHVDTPLARLMHQLFFCLPVPLFLGHHTFLRRIAIVDKSAGLGPDSRSLNPDPATHYLGHLDALFNLSATQFPHPWISWGLLRKSNILMCLTEKLTCQPKPVGALAGVIPCDLSASSSCWWQRKAVTDGGLGPCPATSGVWSISVEARALPGIISCELGLTVPGHTPVSPISSLPCLRSWLFMGKETLQIAQEQLSHE